MTAKLGSEMLPMATTAVKGALRTVVAPVVSIPTPCETTLIVPVKKVVAVEPNNVDIS